ncbi:hypothetical protein [Paracoccus rhizosphaerae]|uniref:hypothetical protein n=1 Tax=Paracoccus rhizosphaerae TaxID=1133347 RepID=UPI00360D75DE
MSFIVRSIVPVLALATFIQPAAAQDRRVSLSIGYGHVEADEKIFDSRGLRSHLTWTAERRWPRFRSGATWPPAGC